MNYLKPVIQVVALLDRYREVIAYFKEHPEEIVKPNGRLDNIEEVLNLIYPVDGK